MTEHFSQDQSGERWALLARYIDGEATPHERAEAEAVLADDPLLARDVARLRDGRRLAQVPLEEFDRANALRQVLSRRLMSAERFVGDLSARGKDGALGAENSRRRVDSLGRWTWRGKIFSGALTAAVLSVLLFASSKTRSVATTRTYATATGQQMTLTLNDGSRVVLAPHTTLRLVGFGAQSRSVEIDGEAYFDVTHTSSLPFVVRSGGVTTRVLGTTFLIRHDAGTARVHVAVENGKVRVTPSSNINGGVTLSAGQIGDVADSTVHVNTAEDMPASAEWTSGQLVFHDTPVATILQILSRWYGYQFRYTDHTLGQRTVTIGISTKSSAEALEAVEEVLAVSLSVVGDTITLVPQPSDAIHGTPRGRTYDVWTPTREVGR